MLQVCKQVVEQIEEQVEQRVEKWVDEVSTVCDDLPWGFDWICKTVTKLVKVLVTVIATVVKAIVVLVCYPVVFLVNVASWMLNLLLLVPIIGALVRWVIGGFIWFWSLIVGVTDSIYGLVGLRPIKHLRLHIVILMREDHTYTVPPDRIGLTVTRTEQIFRARAQVKVHTTVHEVESPSPSHALYVDADLGIFGEDLTGAGVYFQWLKNEMLWDDNASFLAHVGAPIVAFVVDGVGNATQCGVSAGPFTDYVCIEGGKLVVPPQDTPVPAPTGAPPPTATPDQAATTLAHEMGHACGLLHDEPWDEATGDPSNLMYWHEHSPDGRERGDNLSPFQRAIVRSSPHVTYV